MSSTCLAVRRFGLISNSGSKDVDFRPNANVLLRNFIEKARGASLVPVPGLIQWRQRIHSPKVSNPFNVRKIVALPGGSLKHTIRGFSPVALASSSYEKPFR